MEDQDNDRVKFIELKWEEVLNKLSNMVLKQVPLKCWEKKTDAIDLTIRSVDKRDDHILLVMNEGNLTSRFSSNTIMLNFKVNGVDYLTTASLADGEDADRGLIINQQIFKAEKRTSERLLAFPHHQIYVYFKFELDVKSESNIISLNKYREENEKMFQRFSELKAKQELENIDELKDFTGDKLMGFRALDLSLNGVSFLANEGEANFFIDRNKAHDLVVLVNGVSYRLHKAKLVYKVDYLNPRANSVSMYKIGFQFDDNKEFKLSLKGLIENFDNTEELKSEFELFLDI